MTAAKLVTLTKVRLPTRRKDTLRRVRLIDILQRNIHRKLNFISAPAGYGKTSLLIDFATDIDGDADATVCWYSIAAEDVALVPFAQHLIVAFQQRFPGFGRELAQRLASTGVRVDAYSLAVELINEMIRHVDEFCLLMIDDYHLAGENEDIARLIEIVLENLPDQVRIFIAGRSDFGIPSTSLYVRDDLNVLGAEELRFRPNELQDLVGRNYHFKLSDEQAQTLTTRADGWIIAMLMALRSEQHGSIPAFESGGQHLYAFLAEDVVRRQPIEVQEFLTATAVVDEFDEALCAHLLESAAAGERIRQAEARNLFLARIESEDGPSFRYHQLFIEFLRAQVAEQDPARQRALHERAAQWYADRGQYERAVRHARAAGNDAAAIAWMDRAALDYFVSGRLDVLLGWGDQLAAAPELLGDAPHLVVGVAKALSDAGRIDESEAMLDVFESAMESPGLAELQVQALFTRSMNQRLQGEYAEAVEAIRRARGLIDEHDQLRRYQADRYEGYCLGRLNDVDGAIELLKRAADGFRTLEYPHDLAETLSDLGFMFVTKGEIMYARECATAVLEIRRQ
ncbi:MAG: hypothetical protein ACE5FI_14410, partial [Anaerolineales bacterium]